MSVASIRKSISPRKLAANRGNAQKSTGPRSAQGKARSSQNATTHGLFCHAAVLPGEDELVFHTLRAGFMISLNPQDTIELMLVDRIVLANWKLRRLQESEIVLNRVDQHEMLSEEQSEEYQEYEEYEYEQSLPRGTYHIGPLPPRPKRRRTNDGHGNNGDMTHYGNNGDNGNNGDMTHYGQSKMSHVPIIESIIECGDEQKKDPKTIFDDEHPIPAAAILATQIAREDEKRFERLARYEQRLENQILRMMRELRQLRKDREKEEPMATSEFAQVAVKYYENLARQRREEPNERDEPAKRDDASSSPPSPRYAGERDGEMGRDSESEKCCPSLKEGTNPSPPPSPRVREEGVTPAHAAARAKSASSAHRDTRVAGVADAGAGSTTAATETLQADEYIAPTPTRMSAPPKASKMENEPTNEADQLPKTSPEVASHRSDPNMIRSHS